MAIEIRALTNEDDRSSFSCGEIALDYFFQQYAGQNQFKHYIGMTYVAVDDGHILGFAGVSAGSLMRDDLPEAQKKRLPLYPLPVLKITRVGVDKRFQNQGVGKALMQAMLRLSLEQKKMFGCVGVVVHAKAQAVDFYRKLGFVELEVRSGLPKAHPPLTAMFLATKVIEKAL